MILPLPPQVLQGWLGTHDAQHGALLHGDIAAAVAVGANLRRGTRLAAGAMAVRAALHPVDADFLLAAEGSLLKAQGHMDTQILTGNRGIRIGLTGGTAAEAAAEEGAENVAQIHIIKAAEAAAKAATATGSKVRIHPCMAVLVIALARFVRSRSAPRRPR